MCVDFTDLNKACLKYSYSLQKMIVGRCHCRSQILELLGCQLRLLSNLHAPQRRGENDFHNYRKYLLLQSNAIHVEECKGNISING